MNYPWRICINISGEHKELILLPEQIKTQRLSLSCAYFEGHILYKTIKLLRKSLLTDSNFLNKKGKCRQPDCPGRYWGCWKQTSMSPGTNRVVNLTTFPFQWTWLLIGWRHIRQPITSHVREWPSTNRAFDTTILWAMPTTELFIPSTQSSWNDTDAVHECR